MAASLDGLPQLAGARGSRSSLRATLDRLCDDPGARQRHGQHHRSRPPPRLTATATAHDPPPQLTAHGHRHGSRPQPQPRLTATATAHGHSHGSRPQPRLTATATAHGHSHGSRPPPRLTATATATAHGHRHGSRPPPRLTATATATAHGSRLTATATAHGHRHGSRPPPRLHGRRHDSTDAATATAHGHRPCPRPAGASRASGHVPRVQLGGRRAARLYPVPPGDSGRRAAARPAASAPPRPRSGALVPRVSPANTLHHRVPSPPLLAQAGSPRLRACAPTFGPTRLRAAEGEG